MAGTILLLGVPEGTSVGIGLGSWFAGARFRGVHSVPAGPHFVHYSAVGTPTRSAEDDRRFAEVARVTEVGEEDVDAGAAVPANSNSQLQQQQQKAGTGGQRGPRSGFFCFINAGDIITRVWDSANEELVFVDEHSDEFEESQRYLRAVQSGDMSLLEFLAPYPLEQHGAWVGLSHFITADVISRLTPTRGTVSGVYDATGEDTFGSGRFAAGSSSSSSSSEQGVGSVGTTGSGDFFTREQQRQAAAHAFRERRLTDAEAALRDQLRAGTSAEELQSQSELRDAYRPLFSFVPARYPPRGLTREQITLFGVDKSVALETLLQESWLGKENGLLGEMQFAFVCFFLGQSFDGFEQWKRFVIVICRSVEIVERRMELIWNAAGVLGQQLAHVPPEFFALDDVEDFYFHGSSAVQRDGLGVHKSFLAICLRDFLEVLLDPKLPLRMNARGEELRNGIVRRFGANVLMPRRGHDILKTASPTRVQELYAVTGRNGSTRITQGDFFDPDDEDAPTVVAMDDLTESQRELLQQQWQTE